MSSREPTPGDGGSGPGEQLSAVLPIDRSAVESLSWDLGTRITGERACLVAIASQRSRSALTVFAATDNTCIVRFRTPVGREKFFGVAAADLRSMLNGLLERDAWSVREGDLDAI